MNAFWKITRNIFQSKWFLRHYTINKRNLLRSRSRPRNIPSFSQALKSFQVCIASTIIPHGKINVEDDLRKALEEGEASIVSLMDELRDLVITVSKEYRACLTNQIEIIKKTGDEASPELPQFRTLANELGHELSEYVVLLKTIGEIAYDHTLVSFMVDKSGLEKVVRKYKELEILLLHEFELNKRKELELLEINIANIIAE